MHVKKGDEVQVIAGEDKGLVGKVLRAYPRENKVVVEGANLQIRATKPQGTVQGGLIEAEGKIDASNVLLYSKKAGKGVRTRTEIRDGKKVRVCTQTGEVLD